MIGIREDHAIILVFYMHHEVYYHILLIAMQGKQPGRPSYTQSNLMYE
jgi:hypothetical protein